MAAKHLFNKRTRLARFIKLLPKIAPIVRGSCKWSFHPGYKETVDANISPQIKDLVTTLKLEVEFFPSRSDCKDIIEQLREEHFMEQLREDVDADKLLTLSES